LKCYLSFLFSLRYAIPQTQQDGFGALFFNGYNHNWTNHHGILNVLLSVVHGNKTKPSLHTQQRPWSTIPQGIPKELPGASKPFQVVPDTKVEVLPDKENQV
jgi:hypothetical protein